MRRALLLAAAALAALPAAAEEIALAPYPVDHEARIDSPADARFLLDGPAGKHGFITARDGKLWRGDGKRFRCWGVNMTGWAVGLLMCAMLIRFGLAAESFAWASIFLLAPICGVYYPVATLPGWLQPVAWALPPTHVFEGMRSLVIDGTFRGDLMVSAVAINLVYIAGSLAVFLFGFRRARERGQLLQTGE